LLYLQLMATNKIILGTGIVAAIILIARGVLRKGEAIKALNVNVVTMDFNKKEKTFVVKLRLINPANASIRIKSIVGDVLWKGNAAATIDYRNEFILRPNEERTIDLPIKLNLSLATVVSDLIFGKAKDALNGKFQIKAFVNAEGLVTPFEYEKDFKLV
jgi:LEA14-like dessication related protein